MSLDIPTLSTLSTTDVAARLALIQAAVAELAPSYERRRGVLHDVVLSLHATLDTAINQAVTDATSAYSLAAILEDPTLATDEAVDALVSNYRVTAAAWAVANASSVRAQARRPRTTLPTVAPWCPVTRAQARPSNPAQAIAYHTAWRIAENR
jgi:hypothetical protein